MYTIVLLIKEGIVKDIYAVEAYRLAYVHLVNMALAEAVNWLVTTGKWREVPSANMSLHTVNDDPKWEEFEKVFLIETSAGPMEPH